MPNIADIQDFIAGELQSSRFPDDQGGILRPSPRDIRRLGFALQTDDNLVAWAARERIDALFLHRYFDLDFSKLPEDIGVIGCHRPFDAQLTAGSNAPLARELGLANLKDFGEKDGYPLGMIGNIAPYGFDDFVERVAQSFGDLEGVAPGSAATVGKVAVVGAMTDALVREASALGCDIFITGQFREGGRIAVEETGIGLVAIGHERAEMWGLRVLARLVELAFPGVESVIFRKNRAI